MSRRLRTRMACGWCRCARRSREPGLPPTAWRYCATAAAPPGWFRCKAEVSTCIAGWLGRKPDMIPMRMAVNSGAGENGKTFNVQVVRQRSLLAALVYAALTNSVDMEGELPEELTAELQARIEVEGHDPVVIKDTYSGSSYSGGRAPQALYNQIAGVVNAL